MLFAREEKLALHYLHNARGFELFFIANAVYRAENKVRHLVCVGLTLAEKYADGNAARFCVFYIKVAGIAHYRANIHRVAAEILFKTAFVQFFASFRHVFAVLF